MPKATRTVAASGSWYVIEFAMRSDFTEPALDGFRELRAGEFGAGEPHRHTVEEQVEIADWLLAMWQDLADYGEPDAQNEWGYNYLESGIWEFKRSTIRILFFDTDGAGTYSEHSPGVPRTHFSNWQWPDDLAHFLRLTSIFEKRSQRTPLHEINFARQVRREDLNHDA